LFVPYTHKELTATIGGSQKKLFGGRQKKIFGGQQKKLTEEDGG
jgi:hypothetical protein